MLVWKQEVNRPSPSGARFWAVGETPMTAHVWLSLFQLFFHIPNLASLFWRWKQATIPMHSPAFASMCWCICFGSECLSLSLPLFTGLLRIWRWYHRSLQIPSVRLLGEQVTSLILITDFRAFSDAARGLSPLPAFLCNSVWQSLILRSLLVAMKTIRALQSSGLSCPTKRCLL